MLRTTASCWGSTFSACSAGVRTRDFGDCTLGAATLSGAVALTFNRAALCVVVVAGDAVTRTADFTLTGPYGGTLEVTSPAAHRPGKVVRPAASTVTPPTM